MRALKDVDFDVHGGEIHCLVGENGAGKSTLIRILTGAQSPDSGSIEVDGREFDSLTPAIGQQLGIGAIYQETDLVMQLSVADNIFLGHERVTRGGLLDRAGMDAEVRRLMGLLNASFSPETIVRDLGPAQRQLVQIAKSLSRRIRFLILDEPTAALTENEIGRLFVLLNRLKADGIGMIYVSHRLNEIMEIADRVTVMRDGEKLVTAPVGDFTKDKLIEAMVGRQIDADARRRSSATDEVVLKARGLTVAGQFEDIGFTLHKGEILGLAGLVGAGRSELLECLFGVSAPSAGTIELDGREIQIRSTRHAVRLGFGLVPEERRESGLIIGRSVAENLAFAILDKITRWLMIDRGRLRANAGTMVGRLGIRTPTIDQRAGLLSGGNQQKVVIGKWLASDPRILLLDEPTRGIDINAKFEIYELVRELAAQGISIVVASSELPELLALCDRILVLASGRKVAEFDGATASQVEIMRHAVGRGEMPPKIA
ncbi:MAG: sugar ABC transporter ATP-binding protein [Bauldia sp.]|nr:sugar ABC transporter ATP-binding protein [Bauldia sp.]